MKKAVLFFGLMFSLTALALGQARTVTNSTLQKFQDKRLAAERDYRENYARMGFPSPEELDRQRDADMEARLQLADQLRQARLEKERLELERRSLELDRMAAESAVNAGSYDGFYGGYFGGFGGFYGNGFFGGRRHGRFNRFAPFSGGYRATPVGIYPNPSPIRIPFILRGGHRRGGGVIIKSGRH
jgi:hypothetical protein